MHHSIGPLDLIDASFVPQGGHYSLEVFESLTSIRRWQTLELSA